MAFYYKIHIQSIVVLEVKSTTSHLNSCENYIGYYIRKGNIV